MGIQKSAGKVRKYKVTRNFFPSLQGHLKLHITVQQASMASPKKKIQACTSMLLHKRLSNFPDCIFVILPRPCTYQTLVKKMKKKELDCSPLLFLTCEIKHLQFLLQFSQKKNHPKGCFFFFFSSFGPYNQLVLVMKSDSRANMHKTSICETGFSFLMHYHNVVKKL